VVHLLVAGLKGLKPNSASAKFKLLEKTRQDPASGADEKRMGREVYERHRYEEGEAMRDYQESIQLSGAYAARRTSWRAQGRRSDGPSQIRRAKG
jgi:hypothetical protein